MHRDIKPANMFVTNSRLAGVDSRRDGVHECRKMSGVSSDGRRTLETSDDLLLSALQAPADQQEEFPCAMLCSHWGGISRARIC